MAETHDRSDPWRPGTLAVAVGLALAGVAPLAVPLAWAPEAVRLSLNGHPTLALVSELERPLTVRSLAGTWTLLLIAAWYVLGYRRRDVRRWETLLVVAGAAVALPRLGNVWLLALLLLPPLVRRVALARPAPAVSALAVVALLGVLGWAAWSSRPPALPARLAETVRQDDGGGAVLVHLPWASSTRQAAAGGRVVYGSGDPWAAPTAFWPDYQKITLAHVDWEHIAAQHGVDLLVLDPRVHARLADAVRGSPRWQVLTDTDGGLVARRR